MLEKNQTAPNFTSMDQHGNTVTLSDLLEKHHLVLYFYPKDDTPGCTIEANQFTALTSEFAAANTKVIGISKDDCNSHRAFIEKFKLSVDLLADTSGELCELFNVWQEKEKNCVKKMGIVRSTFVINQQGQLAHVEYGVNPEGHAQTILDIVRQL